MIAALRTCSVALAGVGLLLTTPGATAMSVEAAGPISTTVTAEPSAGAVTVGAEVTLEGSVTPPDLVVPRTAVLQVKTGTGWREVGRTFTDAAGAYSLTVPTDWYDDHVLRVVAPATETFAEGVSPQRTVTVAPSYEPRGKASAWKRFSSRARWDPCTVVDYRTNLRIAPKGSLRLVTRAFAAVHAATGLVFRHAGSTKKVPFSGGPDHQQFGTGGLVIAWTTPKVVGALAGGTAGIGGATATSVNGGPWRYVYGGVAVDATQKLPAKGFRKGKSPGALLLHEIAHALGLGHVKARSQIMFPSLQAKHRGRYEAGDLAGLRAVGAGEGCFQPVPSYPRSGRGAEHLSDVPASVLTPPGADPHLGVDGVEDVGAVARRVHPAVVDHGAAGRKAVGDVLAGRVEPAHLEDRPERLVEHLLLPGHRLGLADSEPLDAVGAPELGEPVGLAVLVGGAAGLALVLPVGRRLLGHVTVGRVALDRSCRPGDNDPHAGERRDDSGQDAHGCHRTSRPQKLQSKRDDPTAMRRAS